MWVFGLVEEWWSCSGKWCGLVKNWLDSGRKRERGDNGVVGEFES